MGRIPVYWLCGLAAFCLCGREARAENLVITTTPSNNGYVETANVSYARGRMFVEGWLKPHAWSNGEVRFQVDVRNAAGMLIASKRSYSIVTGRPQMIRQFGVSFLVSFRGAQVRDAAAVDVRYLN